MYRAIPESNKLLSRRWREKEREIHQQKLHQMRPTVEIKQPPTFAHLQKKLKKTQMQEGKKGINNSCFLERYTEIERENRILLEKMTHIMQQQQQNLNNTQGVINASQLHNRSALFSAQTAGLHSAQEIGKNPPEINNDLSKTGGLMNVTTGFGAGGNTSALSSQKKSLNRDARRRELIKITLENQALLRRLQ